MTKQIMVDFDTGLGLNFSDGQPDIFDKARRNGDDPGVSSSWISSCLLMSFASQHTGRTDGL